MVRSSENMSELVIKVKPEKEQGKSYQMLFTEKKNIFFSIQLAGTYYAVTIGASEYEIHFPSYENSVLNLLINEHNYLCQIHSRDPFSTLNQCTYSSELSRPFFIYVGKDTTQTWTKVP